MHTACEDPAPCCTVIKGIYVMVRWILKPACCALVPWVVLGGRCGVAAAAAAAVVAAAAAAAAVAEMQDPAGSRDLGRINILQGVGVCGGPS